MSLDNLYESNSAKVLRIGIAGRGDLEVFKNLLVGHLLPEIKLCQNFTVGIDVINGEVAYQCYNYIFYLTSFSSLADKNILADIKHITADLVDPRNHLFVVVDGCENMEMDDDGELAFIDNNDNKLYNKFAETLVEMLKKNTYHISKISIRMANIWNTISADSSIVNLTDDQIQKLYLDLAKKTSKSPIVDKKKEIKILLKKVKLDDKLSKVGYNDLSNLMNQYFKMIHQKKVVCHNYLYQFSRVNIGFRKEDLENINALLKEIYGISYLKSEMYDELVDKIDAILLAKLKHFYDKCKNNVAIDTRAAIDAYEYHNFLAAIVDISKGYNLSNIMQTTKAEIETVNNIIIEYHKKEMEKVTDLEKIASLLEIFANKDRSNFIGLFDKIRTHPKIMEENIKKMDKWILFIDKSLKLGIPIDAVFHLMEDIIIHKISYYTNLTNNTNTDINIIYPQCLHIFLLMNLDKNFIFKKLFMFLSYSIRYSGKNIADLIRNLRPDQYHNLLVLENRFLQMSNITYDEISQPMILSEMDIVETFNEEFVEQIAKPGKI